MGGLLTLQQVSGDVRLRKRGDEIELVEVKAKSWHPDRSGDFRPLRFLPKGKMVVLGLVTTKFGTLESKDDLKRRIAEAAQYAPLDQLGLSPQCGFSSTVHGNNIAVEAQRAKLRLVIETAQEVWGDA